MFFNQWNVYDIVMIAVSIFLLINQAMTLRVADMAKRNKVPGVSEFVISNVMITSSIFVILSSLLLILYAIKIVKYFMGK